MEINKQHYERMFNFIERMTMQCKTCPRRGTSTCVTCYAVEAKDIINRINEKPLDGKLVNWVDRSKESEEILEMILSSCGVTYEMICRRFPTTPIVSVRHIVLKLFRRGEIVAQSNGGRIKVYFPKGTPQEIIDGTAPSFQKKETNEKTGKTAKQGRNGTARLSKQQRVQTVAKKVQENQKGKA